MFDTMAPVDSHSSSINLNQKVGETEKEQQNKLRAYKEVTQLFKERMEKVSAEFEIGRAHV